MGRVKSVIVFLSFVSICKKVFEHTVNTLDVSVIDINVPSLISGSDIVQWMIKNLDIEDPGKGTN